MDDFFNDVAANKVYDLVMGMPEAEAREFAKHVVYGMLHEDIENNRRTIVSKVNQIHAELLRAAERTPIAHELVPAIALVAKADWDENRSKRDERGRFARYERRSMRGKGKEAKFIDNKDYQANAMFDLVEALSRNQQAAQAAGQAAHGVGRGGSAFEQKWWEAGAQDSTNNARTYRRIQAGSELLGQISGAPQAQIAAGVGEFVGQYGPMAEKVLGPHARRTAYRYRGTEKSPDQPLIRAANEQMVREVMPELPSNVPSQKIAEARRTAVSNITPEQRMVATTSAAIGYFRDKLPELELADLQQKSGRIPPSEGVILDRNGKMVAQASGFADDHYLPFNLRNLQDLKGGTYIRTRTTGGLTTEDIYTGLMSGAREVSVVSHSGIFTITFEDDFRGARRYNDKAKGMVQRYGKTLDAIKSGRAEREKIDMRTKAEIRQEVEEELGSFGASRQEIEAEYKARLDRFQRSPELRNSELERIAAQAKEAGGGDKRKEAQAYNDMLEHAEQSRLNRHYKLDGEGYAAAIRALREQYPYYIKDVSYFTPQQAKNFGEKQVDYSKEPNGSPQYLRDMGFKRTTDAGYVAAGYNRPEKALEGYWDPNIAGKGSESYTDTAGKTHHTGKTPAAFTDYQNWANNPLRTGSLKTGGEEGTPNKPAAAPGLKNQSLRAAEEQRQVAIKMKTDTRALVKRVTDVGSAVPSQYRTLHAAVVNGELDEIIEDSDRRGKLVTDIINMAAYNVSNGPNDQVKAEAADLKRKAEEVQLAARMGTAGVPWTKEKMGQSQRAPFGFDEKGYKAGDPPQLTQQKMDGVDAQFMKITQTGRKLSDLDDNALRQMAVSAGRTAESFKNGGSIEFGVLELADAMYGGQATDDQKSLMHAYFSQHKAEATDRAAKIAELAERTRSLKHRASQNAGRGRTATTPNMPAAPVQMTQRITGTPPQTSGPINRIKVRTAGYNLDDSGEVDNMLLDLEQMIDYAGVEQNDFNMLAQSIKADNAYAADLTAKHIIATYGGNLQNHDRDMLKAFYV